MFNLGDAVVYSNTGVCIIEDIRPENFRGCTEDYYVLRPLYIRGSIIFCPVTSTAISIRYVFSKEELNDALSSVTPGTWIENDHARKEHFTSVLRTCDFSATVSMLLALLRRKEEKEKSGKKLHAIDEKFLADAEKIVFGEISHVFGIPLEEASEMFISSVS